VAGGFRGVVVPAAYMTEYDKFAHRWSPKWKKLVFCHGDLAPHNIMFLEAMLELLSLYD
jgi:thiamine kinase-like enzyme